MRRQSLRTLLALLIAVGLLFGLLKLGQWARDHLHRQNYYTIQFADVRCDVPPGLTAAGFLAEVQYLGSLPDRIDVLEPRLTVRLAAAFALHPWVERVDGVALRGPDGPSVRLQLRTPVLSAAGRVLDANGVLLPTGAHADGLPILRGTVPSPTGASGTPWGNANVEGAARTAAWVREATAIAAVEITTEGLVLTTKAGTKVVWGRPTGADPQGEPSPETKRDRLRELADRSREIDLRKN